MPKPTESATTAPVQTNVIYVPPPVAQKSPSGNGNNNDMAGSSGLVNIKKPPPSPILDPDGETAPSVFLSHIYESPRD